MLTWQSHFQHKLGNNQAADQLLEQGQQLQESLATEGVGTRLEQAFILFERGDLNFNSDRNVAADYYEQSLEIYREVGDVWEVARTLASLGMVNHHMGAFEQAAQHWHECLEIHRRIGDPRGIADALVELGMNLVRSGQHGEGEGYMKEGTAILQGIGDQASLARGYYELCRPQYWIHGDFAKSYEYLGKSCQIYYELGFRERWMFSRLALDLFLLNMGKYKEGYNLTIDDLAHAENYNLKREIGFGYYNLGVYGLATRDLENAFVWTFKSARNYHELGLMEFWCNSLAVLIFITHAMGRKDQACDYMRQALSKAISIKAFFTTMHITLAGALLMAEQGQLELALELAALANRYPYVGNSHWCQDAAGPEIKAIEESLPPEVVTAAKERGLRRDIWETAEELLEIFEGEAQDGV